MNKDIVAAVRDRLAGAEDNLHRARSAFRGLSAQNMQEQYGQSGSTRAQIIADYESEVARWKSALSEAEGA